MKKTTALYAYFGEIGITFSENIPGHAFYQLGLIQSLSEKYGIEKFDFLNYAKPLGNDLFPDILYPEHGIGKTFNQFYKSLISNYLISEKYALDNIKDAKYEKLFLKARFRNLSTLSKKMKDVKVFENLIEFSISSGYSPKDIVILDTDLSLGKSFIETAKKLGITIETPSITIPAIGGEFLSECLDYYESNKRVKSNTLLYYGNLDFSNYKEGHSKNPIVLEVLRSVHSMKMFDGSSFDLVIASKKTENLSEYFKNYNNTYLIGREERGKIWYEFINSLASINVSKDLYLEKGFRPARLYEALIFGAISISYNPKSNDPMEFNTVEDFIEICKFLKECQPSEYFKILRDQAEKFWVIPNPNK